MEIQAGDGGSSQHTMRVLLSTSQNTATTDINGLVSLAPSTGGQLRPLEVEIMATAGTGATLQFELPVLSAISSSPGASTGRARAPARSKIRFAARGNHPARQSFAGVSSETPRWSIPVWDVPAPVPIERVVRCSPDPAAPPAGQREQSTPPDSVNPVPRPVGALPCPPTSGPTPTRPETTSSSTDLPSR